MKEEMSPTQAVHAQCTPCLAAHSFAQLSERARPSRASPSAPVRLVQLRIRVLEKERLLRTSEDREHGADAQAVCDDVLVQVQLLHKALIKPVIVQRLSIQKLKCAQLCCVHTAPHHNTLVLAEQGHVLVGPKVVLVRHLCVRAAVSSTQQHHMFDVAPRTRWRKDRQRRTCLATRWMQTTTHTRLTASALPLPCAGCGPYAHCGA